MDWTGYIAAAIAVIAILSLALWPRGKNDELDDAIARFNKSRRP